MDLSKCKMVEIDPSEVEGRVISLDEYIGCNIHTFKSVGDVVYAVEAVISYVNGLNIPELKWFKLEEKVKSKEH